MAWRKKPHRLRKDAWVQRWFYLMVEHSIMDILVKLLPQVKLLWVKLLHQVTSKT